MLLSQICGQALRSLGCFSPREDLIPKARWGKMLPPWTQWDLWTIRRCVSIVFHYSKVMEESQCGVVVIDQDL